MKTGPKIAMLVLTLLAACGRAPGTPPAVGQGPRPSGYVSSGHTPYPPSGGGGVINMPIDAGTYGRLARAAGDLQTCEATLSQARVTFSPTPDRVNSETCGLTDAGVLGPDFGTKARMAPNGPTMTCALAAALSVWRRQSVEPAAREILGAQVAEIDHMGVYACRAVNSNAGGDRSNRPSAHSRAAAIDFSGVMLADGRRITVTGDWNDPGPRGRFLHRIRDDACKVFGTTLSPDYNALHHDHLHLEAEPARFCR